MTARWRPFFVPVILLWVLLCSSFLAWRMSMTTDEGIHVASGYLAITRQDHRFDPEHPFLFKYLTALPLLALRPNLPAQDQALWEAAKPTLYDSWKEAREWSDSWFYASGNNAKLMIFLARLPGVFVLVSLCYLVYFLGKRWFSESVGLWAMFFTGFNPTILAHGSTTNTDVPLAFAFLLALWALWEYWERPALRSAAIVGLGIAGVLLTKFSGLAIIPIAVIWFLYTFIRKRLPSSNILHVLVVVLTVLATIWVVYFFKSPLFFNGTAVDPLLKLQFYLTDRGMSVEEVCRILSYLVPTAFLKGGFLVGYASSFGRETYLLNTVFESGVWYYFPAVFFLKTQVMGLVLGATGLGLALTSIRKKWKPIAVLLIISTAVLAVLFLRSKLNLGIRHISPLLPLFSLGIGLAMTQIHQLFTSRVLVATVAILYALPVFLRVPHLLSFSNVLIWPHHKAYLYFDDSNLDWGQQAEEIANVIAKKFPNQKIASAYFWNPYSLGYFGATVTRLDPLYPPSEGIVVVTGTQLARDKNYLEYRNVTPVHRIANHTFFYRASDLPRR